MAETTVTSVLKMDRADPIGNSDDGTGRRALHVKSLSQLVSEKFDSIYAAYPNTTTEVYTYKLSGATVATVTVLYVDATKAQLVSVIRS